MKNGIKSTQELIMHLFKKKNSIKNKNDIYNKNSNLLLNHNNNIFSQNLTKNIKPGNAYSNINIYNLTNRVKYKTSKNSPENILVKKNLSEQKKYMNKSNNNKAQMNNSSKIIINNNTKDDIIKKKILHIKEKKNIPKSNNNSMNIYNNIYQNYINNIYIKSKGMLISKIKRKNANQTNQKENSTKKSYTYREINKKLSNNYEIKKSKFNEEIKKGKYFNLINQYISSISAASKQPHRPNNQKNRFMTINAKKVKDIYKQNSINNSQIYKKLGITMENTNIENINKIKNIGSNQNIKNNFVFSSTTNSLNKKNKKANNQIHNFPFDLKKINQTSYQSKQASRLHSLEKSIQNSINQSSLNQKLNSNNSIVFIKNYNSPSITMYNRQNSEIVKKTVIKKSGANISEVFNNNININNDNSNNKKNINNSNILNINNNINNNFNKYLFNGVFNINITKDISKEKKKSTKNNIIDLKRKVVEKSLNNLYKQKEKEYNYLMNIKEVKDNISFNHLNKKSKSNVSINYVKERKSDNYKENKNKENIQDKLDNKEKNNIIKENDNNFSFQNQNKDYVGNKIKEGEVKEIKVNNLIKNDVKNNSVINDNENNKKNIIVNKKNKEKEKENDKEKEKEKVLNKCKINLDNINNKKIELEDLDDIKESEKEENNEDKNKKESEKEKERENFSRDKDLSCSENDNDSLFEYVNMNVDYIPTNKVLNTEKSESNDSLMNSLKESGKYTCYNRDMEIISNYIKKYYKKNKKYPNTKMKFYKYGRLLGKGAFGKVNLCLHTLTGRLVAIKSINKEKIKTDRHLQKIKQETAIMEALSKSKNIVKIFETYETKNHICIVMEYICAGDLLTYIKKRSKLTELVAKFIFKQIILAIKYIHDNNIIHRDIKLDNILLDLDNNIKICDFGVSRKINKGDIMFEQCGTPAYIAPEILLNKGYEGFGVDIWSAGVVLYAMLSGTVPFKGNNLKELHNLIINGKYKEIKGISKDAEDLLKNLLEVDPNERIQIEEILNHPWIIDVDFNYWKNQNLFTNAEYVLLAKSNVDYRNIAFKEDMIENFDIRNLDTFEENINKNIHTKSIILAPFNTSISESDIDDKEYETENNYIIINKSKNKKKKKVTLDMNNPDLKILNGAIKFVAKVKDINRNYELNNNQEIDNGVVITPNDSEDKDKDKKNELPKYLNAGYNTKYQSRHISPPNELNEENNTGDEINENALEMLQNLGYKKSFTKKCLIKNEFNYATTSYQLIVKYCFS